MTNRKNYNSILFLTVYLGLVLVGGGSHVFAHAASNALFELRNEIEFKEDLDNKPDDSCAQINSTDKEYDEFFEAYAKRVINFLKHYSPNSKGEMLNGVGSHDDYKLPQFFSVNSFILRANKSRFLGKFDLNLDLEKNNSTPYILAFNQSLKFQRCKTQDSPKKIIYENTKVLSSNNQVFIVTRLPRGSIDSLLK